MANNDRNSNNTSPATGSSFTVLRTAPERVRKQMRQYQNERTHKYLDRFQLTATMILELFKQAAEYLGNQNEDVTLIAVGAAVDAIHVRPGTNVAKKDLCLFPEELIKGSWEERHLCEAEEFAMKRAGEQAGFSPTEAWQNNESGWLREARRLENRGAVGVQGEYRARLVRDSREQGIVLFRSKGLEVLATPWEHGFINKLTKASWPGWLGSDKEDSARYLRKWQEQMGQKGRPVTLTQVHDLAEKYGTKVNAWGLANCDEAYWHLYGGAGVEWNDEEYLKKYGTPYDII